MKEKVEVTLKSGAIIQVLPKEVAGLRKAGVLSVKSKQKRVSGNTKEEKGLGKTKSIITKKSINS